MFGARRYLPSMPSLLALEAVDRLGSASAAATELALTQGAISRQLQVLEGQMGAALLAHKGGKLALTPAGRDYVRAVRAALQTLASASLTLRANPLGGSLNLAILPAFGMHWLAPKLADFAAKHPEVTINLSTRLRPFDLAAEGMDAAIHYGREDWPNAHHLPLLDESLIAVASPSLLPKPLAQADEVISYPLLQIEGRMGDWGRWLAHFGAPPQRPPAMLFDQFSTMTMAALHGLGIALLPTFLIERDLKERRLIPAFGPAIPALGRYFLVWPKDTEGRAPLTSFRAWIETQL